MKNKLMMAAALATVLIHAPAYAQTSYESGTTYDGSATYEAGEDTNVNADSMGSSDTNVNADVMGANSGTRVEDRGVTGSVQSGLRSADENLRQAADEVTAFLVGEEDMASLSVPSNRTARGMIGETIVTPTGDRVAEVEDIIIDDAGYAQKIIVADGGLLGIGEKHVAFDYSRVISQQGDDNVVMQISQDMIDMAKEIANDSNIYDQDRLPANQISVNALLEGKLYDNNGKEVAEIDNVTFENGRTEHLIVKFDQTLGMGGKAAALGFDTLQWNKGDGQANATLSASQSAEFQKFQSAVKG